MCVYLTINEQKNKKNNKPDTKVSKMQKNTTHIFHLKSAAYESNFVFDKLSKGEILIKSICKKCTNA